MYIHHTLHSYHVPCTPYETLGTLSFGDKSAICKTPWSLSRLDFFPSQIGAPRLTRTQPLARSVKKYSREKTTCPGLRQRASTSLCVREQPPRTSLPLPRYNPPPLTSINTLRPNLSTNSRGAYHFCRAPDKTRPQHHNDAIGLNSEPHTFNTTRYPTVNEAKPPRELLN